MGRKKTTPLGSTTEAALELLKDKELRRDVMQVAERSANTIGKFWKWTGIVLAAGIGAIVITKVVKKVSKNAESKKEARQLTDGMKKSNLTQEKAVFESWANKLYTAFNADASYWHWFDEASIIDVLNRIGNEDDWKMLVYTFGSRYDKPSDKKLNLVDFLRMDGEYDVAKYNKILASKGVKTLI